MAENQVVEVPDYLKSLMASGEVSTNESIITAASSVPRISLKGQKFRFIKDGEEVRKETESIMVILLGVQPDKGTMCKTYYKDGYSSDDSSPPDCSSSDGIRPDSWISSPVSQSCQGCPMNAWGSAESMSGGKAKACRDSKRLFVVDPKDGPIDESDGYILNVTVASLKALAEYGKYLVANNIPMEAVITRIIMDDDSDFPRISFEMAGIMKEEAGMASITRAKKKEWVDVIASDAPQLENQQTQQQIENQAPTNTVIDVEVASNGPTTIEGEVVDEAQKAQNEQAAPAADKPAEDVDDILSKWT